MFNRDNDINFNSTVVGNNNVVDNDMNVDINTQNSPMNMGGCCNPISEVPQVRCVHRTIVHEVPHVW